MLSQSSALLSSFCPMLPSSSYLSLSIFMFSFSQSSVTISFFRLNVASFFVPDFPLSVHYKEPYYGINKISCSRSLVIGIILLSLISFSFIPILSFSRSNPCILVMFKLLPMSRLPLYFCLSCPFL